MSESIIDDIDSARTGNAKIKVIGVGGGGGNAVQQMIDSNLEGVQFICANTDLQALRKNGAPFKIQLGEKLTKGLGAGAKPEVGRDAALESVNAIREAIGDADMVFVTAGMGGGTGTGAAPVIAQAAKEEGILTVGVVTKPFMFEGRDRKNIAEGGVEELKKFVDSLIVIPNDRLANMAGKKMTYLNSMQMANQVLYNAVRGICDVITSDGFTNVDFADVKTTMTAVGMALMGTGRACGENRAKEAAQAAIMSPLLEDVSLESAKAILYNITANSELGMDEVQEIGTMIHEAVDGDPDIKIIYGVVIDDKMGDDLQVTVIATGIEQQEHVEEEVLPTRDNVTQFRDSRARIQRNDGMSRKTQQAAPENEPQFEAQPVNPPRRPAADTWYEERPARPYYGFKGDVRRPPVTRHMPGKDSPTYDNSDLDIPAFLRTQAD